MGKECKKARNTIGLAILVLMTLLLTLQSCSTQYTSCAGVDGGRKSMCSRR